MEPINWSNFFLMLLFCLFGFLFHLLMKYAQARKRSDFSHKTFFDRNWLAWIIAWIWCLLGVWVSIRFPVAAEKSIDLIGISIGISGGTVGKNLVKLFIKKLK